MELINATKMVAGYTMGLRPDGRELLVVAVKGTFTIPAGGDVCKLAEKQMPLVEADEFTGEPGFSAPLYESDYPPVKPKCDVLLNGSAYAPGSRSAARVVVGLKVGNMEKKFAVVGNRTWKKGLMGISATQPEPFHTMPISYDVAFGGTDKNHPDEKKHAAFMSNPVGRGFHEQLAAEFVNGKQLPNTEEESNSVTSPRGKYRAMSFGPIARAWDPRPKYAGTYDQNWVDNVFPFLPADFDERYYQAAPEDQQINHPQGGEEVVLTNLTPSGSLAFKLPTMEVPVIFFKRSEEKHETKATLDTIVLEPDQNRLMMVWRASIPLKRNIFEVVQVVVGEMSPAWHRARALGKTYYPSLGALVAAKADDDDAEAD